MNVRVLLCYVLRMKYKETSAEDVCLQLRTMFGNRVWRISR